MVSIRAFLFFLGFAYAQPEVYKSLTTPKGAMLLTLLQDLAVNWISVLVVCVVTCMYLNERKQRHVERTKRLIADARVTLTRFASSVLPDIKLVTKQKLSNINVPEEFQVSDELLYEVTRTVTEFNNDLTSTFENSGSFQKSRSIHNIWFNIFALIRESDTSPKPAGSVLRILYECSIPHNITRASLRIDYSFISAEVRSLSWDRLRGGIELKNNPKTCASKSAKGNLNDGYKQALARCAMCVHERAEACKWSIGPKGEKAFMLYGDARQVGLVCVQLDAEMSVAVTHYEPSNLPGFNGSTDPTPLRLLLFILTAQDEDLGQIMSLMQGFEARRVTGVSQESGEQEEWEVATSLGQGGFGYVCALKKKSSDDQMTFPVIKSLVLPENFSRLENERIVLLSLLSCRCQSIPLCVDALQVSTLGSRVCALKLSARGVAIPKYLRSVQVKQETAFEGHISSLVRALGPSIVEALKFAHEKMICHCDVRPPNLIIVPPPATMAQIEKHEGDMAEFVVISRIDVSAENGCYFLLNDWGEAELFRSKTVQFENQKKKDLQSLVKALASPEHLMTGSNVSSGSSPASRPENGYQRFFLNALVIKNLSDLAQSLNYDALSAAFKSVSFQDLEPSS